MIKAAILITLVFIGGIVVGRHMDETHQYVVQDIVTPQTTGPAAHDYARVDLTTGTMCSLNDGFTILYGGYVPPCKAGK
jgi:hypothetical protein